MSSFFLALHPKASGSFAEFWLKVKETDELDAVAPDLLVFPAPLPEYSRIDSPALLA